jgi:hypothetical protein
METVRMGIEGLYRAASMAGFAMAATEELPIMRSPGTRGARALYPTTEPAMPRVKNETEQAATITQRVGNFIGSFGAKMPA